MKVKRILIHQHRQAISSESVRAGGVFHSLKVEASHGGRFETREIMPRQMLEYIELDYSRQ